MNDDDSKKLPKASFPFEKIYVEVLELLLKKYPSEINYSMVSRVAKVPRSTLYYYFGKKVDHLIQESIRYGMKQFTRLRTVPGSQIKDQYPTWLDYQEQRLHEAVTLMKIFPWIPSLYFRYRLDSNVIGEEIRDFENQYVKDFQSSWKLFFEKDIDISKVRLITYARLGVLWGLTQDLSLWNDKQLLLEKFAAGFYFAELNQGPQQAKPFSKSRLS